MKTKTPKRKTSMVEHLLNAKKAEQKVVKALTKAARPNAVTSHADLHPKRFEDGVQYIGTLKGTKSRKYATARLRYIWNGGTAPKVPDGLKASRVQEIDDALYAMFTTKKE